MTEAARPRPLSAAIGGLLLALAMPGVLPLGLDFAAPLLVVPGLMAWFAVGTASGRPRRDSYLFGCLFMAVFSWSLHHVMVPAYVAVVVLGGLYFVLGTIAMRGSRWPVVAFALAVAGTFWLRAYMPEIYYPHGQPAHALYRWPLLLGAVSLGGEALSNALLAALAAAGVQVWRGWRLAEPALPAARNGLVAVLAFAVAATGGGHWLRSVPDPVAEIDVAAIETGLHSLDVFSLDEAGYRDMLSSRLLGPTRDLLAGAPPPDLVLWPETALPHVRIPAEDLAAGRARIRVPGGLPASDSRLVLGALIVRGARPTPSALLVELPSGRVIGHNEKRRIVPGGEFLPLTRVLPESLGAAMLAAFEGALGGVPDFAAGVAQPLLTTANGHRFGALLCYDNAFPEPARDLVGAGAQFLVVLSNETWYRGGAELAQLVAMTVCRALETGVPIVRCTTDGWSVVVDGHGRLRAGLAPEAAPRPARILRAKLALGPSADGPMASWRAVPGPLAAVWLGLAILHGLVRWARLRIARNAA